MLVGWYIEEEGTPWPVIFRAVREFGLEIFITLYCTSFGFLSALIFWPLDALRALKSRSLIELVRGTGSWSVNLWRTSKGWTGDARANYWDAAEELATKQENTDFDFFVSLLPGAFGAPSMEIKLVAFDVRPLLDTIPEDLESELPQVTPPPPQEDLVVESPALIPIPNLALETPPPPPKSTRSKLFQRRVRTPRFVCPPHQLPQLFNTKTGEYGDDQTVKVPKLAIYALAAFIVLAPTIQFVCGPGFAERTNEDGEVKKDRSLGGCVMRMKRKLENVGGRGKKAGEVQEEEEEEVEEVEATEELVGYVVSYEGANEDEETTVVGHLVQKMEDEKVRLDTIEEENEGI
ncbi:hypothetical protein BDY24DRAFT_442056 [Mrakia frigida]|uniref:uncharacterized protein n=1 Tax=Mrakia frigida TaxID=29902 RepID=UPI003FCC0A9A